MRYGSLFSGIGGIDLAFDRAGATCAFQAEINPHPASVLARHWPDVPRFTDVTTMTKETLGDAGSIDVLVGGFPCQDLSVAGGRAGLAGPRSGLWWHFARLLADLAPTWCVIENVPGLLSSNDGRDMGTILGTLGDLGYGFAYRVLDAQWFGVPQRRERVVIVGCAGDWSGPAAVLLEPTSGGGHPPEVDEKEARSALRAGRRPASGRRRRMGGGGDALDADVSGPVLAQGDGGRGWRLEADGSGLVAEVSPPVMAKWAKGTGGPSGDECQNMVVEAIPLAVRGRGDDGDAMLEVGAAGDPYYALRAGDGGSSRQPLVGVFRKAHRAADPDDAETWVEDEQVGTIDATTAHRPEEVVVEVVPVDVRNASRTGGNGEGTPGVGIGDPGGPAFTVCTNPQAQAVAYSVTPEGGQGADLVVRETDVSQTLTAGMAKQSDRQPIFLDTAELVVRRLMPVECLRLQGFPDDWCDGLSDSATYAAAGNAVAVPVFHWVALRLVAHHHAAGLDQFRHAPRPFVMPTVLPDDGDLPPDVEALSLF